MKFTLAINEDFKDFEDMAAKTAPQPLVGGHYPARPVRRRVAAVKDRTGMKVATIIGRALDIGLSAIEADPSLLIPAKEASR